MSDETNAHLLKRIGELERAAADTTGKDEQRRTKLRQLEKVHAELKAAHDALVKEHETALAGLTRDRDEWKGKAEAAPGDVQKENDALKLQIRTRDHRDAWTAAIGTTLAPKATVDKVWAEIGYEPGEKVPAPEQIAEQVGRARDAAPYLFRVADGISASGPAGPRGVQPPLKESLGVGRGAPDTSAGRVTVTKSQLQDYRWKLDKRNAKMLEDASAAGTLEVVDG